ncbi:MAG TPA: cupin domain-containing protein [bacterium]|jgi:mannose-6-phosphate isomerase-like protein (cupin superfamily)
MLIQRLAELPEFIAGDHTRLREMLHPHKQPLPLSYSLAHATLACGHWSSLHVLASSEVYYILQGAGRVEIDGEQRDVLPGDTIYIPPRSAQRIFSIGPADLEFLCIVDPPWRAEDETVLEDKNRK